MYARRFLIFITVLTLLGIAGAVAIFQFGQQVLIDQATPKGNFQESAPSSGPDYRSLANWLSWPDTHGSPAEWVPVGFAGAENPDRGAATFYIHPTTYLKADRWNAPLDDRESQERAALFAQTQGSAFGQVSAVWAPKYRQAAYGAFLLKTRDAQSALNLAYSDISSAFDNFLERVPADQPIILAGHSQGALHLIRLLRDRKEQLQGRIVAAYAVGWPIDSEADLPALGLPACRAPDQAGCILSWLSFADPPNPDLILSAWREEAGLTGAPRNRERLLCVNPISGSVGGSAPPAANPGTLVPTGDFASASLVEGAVGARCANGLLILDGEIPPLGPFVLPGNNYHVYDYALFWGAIRRDSERRLAAWRR